MFLAILIALAMASAAQAAPFIYWNSDPVRPGETAMVIGGGFGTTPTVEVERLADGSAGAPSGKAAAWSGKGRRVEVLQPSDSSVKFGIPNSWKPGVFVYRIKCADGAAVGVLNKPTVWWVQGNLGTAASPGGWLRVFGKCLPADGGAAPQEQAKRHEARSVLLLTGPRTIKLTGDSDGYSLQASLPAELPPGKYELHVHNGSGGEQGWSNGLPVEIKPASQWPAQQLNVKDFGAQGDGSTDDTSAVQAALSKAGANGGGVVYFPRGRYQITATLTVPRFTVLRGEKRELVSLFWPDFADPPENLIQGTNSFGIEDLTLYASNHRNIIAGDLGDKPDAGNIFLRRLRVRADAYRGHLKPEEVDQRLRAALKASTGGGDTVRLGGPNIEITDCDLYGSGRALFLSRVRGGRIADNTFYNGRWGWYCISGSDGLIFEKNNIIGGDLMSTGGGLNCLDGSANSQHVYYAHNHLRLFHGWDREAMTTDAGGEAYFGKITKVEGATLTLAEPAEWGNRSWQGAGVFILDGKGEEQFRRVVSTSETSLVVDRPFAIEPDADSTVSVTMFQGYYILDGNDFADTGAMQFYGTSIECIVTGNTGARMSGFSGLGLWYHGYQPSWFCQFLGNHITEGNYYHWTSATEAGVTISGAVRQPLRGPLNIGSVVRGNELDNNALIRVNGVCRDAVVEDNYVKNSDTGVFVNRQCANILVRNNHFQNVTHEIADEATLRRDAEAKVKRFLGRKEPVAAFDFESISGNRVPDTTGDGFNAFINGGVTLVAGGIHGQAAKFDGTGYLKVDEPVLFNADNMTVSLWIKPDTIRGRRGLVAKRFSGGGAPFVLSQMYDKVTFEAQEENGPWTFNFTSPGVLKAGEWTQVTAVVRQGEGVQLYADGKLVATKKNPARRVTNLEPLILGREAWGGDPPNGKTPGFFVGLMDDVRIWARALTPKEIRAEFEREAKK